MSLDECTPKTNSDALHLNNLNSLKNIVILETKQRDYATTNKSVVRLSDQYMTRSQANAFLCLNDKRMPSKDS